MTHIPGVGSDLPGGPDVADMSGNVAGDAYFIYIDGEPSSQGGTAYPVP